MKNCVIICDNSNVWIEGTKYSAKQKGVLANVGEKDPCDPSWRIDFGQLINTVAGELLVSKAILVGSRPPKNDSVWNAAKSQGFEVIVHNRSNTGKEKAVDTEIVAQGTQIVCTEQPAVLKLLSGDRDFIPLIKIANGRGWETEMWAFSNAFTHYGDMASSVDKIRPLDEVFDIIGHCEFEWPK